MKILNYKECLEEYGGRARIMTMIRRGELYCIERGLYADTPSVPEESVLLKRYGRTILTLESAYYHYDLSDNLPDRVHLASDRRGVRIKDERVVQYFMPDGTLDVGVTSIQSDGQSLRIYDLERVLIETVRYRTKLSHDLYKEVIGRFREIKDRLYPAKMIDYLEKFPKSESLFQAIEREVF